MVSKMCVAKPRQIRIQLATRTRCLYDNFIQHRTELYWAVRHTRAVMYMCQLHVGLSKHNYQLHMTVSLLLTLPTCDVSLRYDNSAHLCDCYYSILTSATTSSRRHTSLLMHDEMRNCSRIWLCH